jgi:hypothetical protein
MKKVLFLLGVAVFLVTACIKSETLVKSDRDIISFKAMTGNLTKANPEHAGGALDGANYIMYVAASTAENPTLFNNKVFKYDGEASTWKAHNGTNWDPVLWPSNQSVDFLALAGPGGFQTTLSPAFNASPYVNSASVSSWDTYTNQLDVMYAVANNKNKSGGSVALAFQHSQALLSFKAKADAADKVKIVSITINGLEYQGTFTVDNTRSALSSGWSSLTGENKAVKGVNTTDFLPATEATKWTDNLLVPEQLSKSMTIVYTIAGITGNITYELNVPRTLWRMGHKYTYVLDFNTAASEITFTAVVEEWTPESDIDQPIS